MSSMAPTHNTDFQITEIKQEARVDSRLIAGQLEISHQKMVNNLIYKYQSDFEEFGVLPFKKAKVKSMGRPEQYTLLNEDQAYLLLTYSRNTPRVRRLKINLVKAFRRFRESQQVAQDYLPFYHSMHDAADLIEKRAIQSGSSLPEGRFHSNLNRLVNKAFGITPGTRSSLSSSMRLKVSHAQMLATDALERSLRGGMDHKEAYSRVRDLVFGIAEAGMIADQRGML